MQYTEKEKAIIASLCKDLPDSLTPYKDLAIQHNISEEKIFEILNNFKENKTFRRLATLIRHYNTSYSHNALVLWVVKSLKIDFSGDCFAKLDYVSHCYQRQSSEKWPYNLYTMVHAQSADDLNEKIKFMSLKIRCSNYKILNTLKELKKESIIYFEDRLGL